MNAFQTCQNVSDAIPLYLSQQLYLKPIARLKISIQLPQKTMGKSISNWEVMETLRSMIKPDSFSLLKVTKTNLDVVRLEAETDDRQKMEKVITRLNNKMMKLKDFPELLRIRACEAKLEFPTRHMWDAFFREAKNMNEMKSGERPDTIHISNLPIKWFVPYHLSGEDDVKPSEKIFFRVFEKFGQIRRVDIPICDPYRSKMKAEVSGMQIFDFNEEHFFEGYIQFKDYVGFTKTMDALRGMKLLHKTDGEAYMVNINVDFDKTKHLSDASTRRREIVRDRLVQKEIDKEEKERREKEEEERKKEAERQTEIDQKTAKERRRREREEKRKAKILEKLKVKGADEINEKIAKEEKKLLKVQRKLEAIRLVEELFRRIKIKHEKDLKASSDRHNNEDELTRLKNSSELEVRQQRAKLNCVIEGRVVLKSILTGGPRIRSYYDSSSTSSDEENKIKEKKSTVVEASSSDHNVHPAEALLPTGDWYGYPHSNGLYPYRMPAVYPIAIGSHPSNYFPYHPRGRGGVRGAMAGPSRGLPNMYSRRARGIRYRGNFRSGKSSALYPPELQEQYYRYFEKFLHEHDDRSNQSFSKSRSRSRNRSTTRRSRSRSYRRSRSRSYSRNRKSRSRSYGRSKTRRSLSRSRSRSRKRSRSRSRRSSRSIHSSKAHHTPCSSRSKKRSSKSRSRSLHRKSKGNEKSRSPSYRSIDSSKFISPSRLRMPRSKSWSLPRESAVNTRSWSKSPSPKKNS